jgi:hypothetical protein
MANPESDDLNALGNLAHRQIGTRTQHQSKAAGAEHPASRWVLVVLIWLTVAAWVMLNMGGLRTALLGVSHSATQAENNAILSAAKAAVESHRRTVGQLPDRVPLAALEALVGFETTPAGYQLSIETQNSRITMDETGRTTEVKK